MATGTADLTGECVFGSGIPTPVTPSEPIIHTEVRRLSLKLIPDREYLFTHKHKRTFRAVFKRFVRAPATDTLDELYYECEVDPALSGNPWSQMQERAVVLLRPSLITLVQNVSTGSKSIYQQMPLGDGKNVVQKKDKWVVRYMQRIRCSIGDLRKTWSRHRRQMLS